MNLKLALLIAALVFALIFVAVDMTWIEIDGNQHLPTWLGLSLMAYYGHLLAPDR